MAGRDLWDDDAIGQLARKLERFMAGAWLESSSISDGQLTLIRATLLMMGGSLLKGDGTFDWTGPGSIRGNFEVLEGGVIKVGGVLVSPVGGGRIMIGEGPVGIILDGGAGTLTMGNVKMEGDKIYVGTGTNRIVLDGATGKLLAGNLTVDPTKSGGAVTYANGAEVFTDDDTIQVFKGNSVVQVSDDYARLQHGGYVVEIDGNGIRMSPGAIPPKPGTGLPVPGVVIQEPGGYLVKSDGT